MTSINPKTPAQIGLSLIVCSGPRGSVQADWPCIEYTVQVQNARRQVVWTGEYRLGVGHVKPVSLDDMGEAWSFKHKPFKAMTAEAKLFSHHWARTPGANWQDKRLHAETAAQLAIVQKVVPELYDVCASLLSDGSAFFDGERFENWAANLGYSADSIKAKETFEACDKTGRDLSRALSRDDLAALREWASNY